MTMRRTMFLILSGALLVACGGGHGDDDGSGTHDAAVADAPIADAGAPDADCVENPVTSQQLLNACTDAQRIHKDPQLPTSSATGCWFDGTSLPPLP
jgi:hypothetical protein